MQTDLQYIKEDINAVERHRIDLYRARDRYSVKLRMLGDDPNTRNASWPLENNHSGFNSNSLSIRGGNPSGNFQNKKVEGKVQGSSHGMSKKDAQSGSNSQSLNQSTVLMARKKRIHAQVCSFLPAPHYLQKGTYVAMVRGQWHQSFT